MGDVDYDEILIPFLARLVKSLRVTPDPDDLEYMKKTDVKEMKIFFDAGSAGASDREVYQQVLDHIHARQKVIRDAREAEERKLREAREAKERELQAERDAKDAEARRRQEAIDSARKLREDQAREEAEAAAAAAAYDAEMKEKCPGKCLHCGKWIEDKKYLENDGEFLHNGCLEEFQKKSGPKCTLCGQPLGGEFLEMRSAVTGAEAQLHEECVLDWKKITRPNCKKCGEQILDAGMAQAGPDEYYHAACAQAMGAPPS